MNNYAFLGIAQKGRFIPLVSERESGDSYRLTSMPAQAGQSPESGEIALDSYDGLAILVRGIGQGDWIYSAQVVERASQILSVVVQAVFSESGKNDLEFPMG
jgi:hypothetical protein